MNSEQLQLLMVKGAIGKLDPDMQQSVKTAHDELKAVLEKHGDAGILALVLTGAEMAAKP